MQKKFNEYQIYDVRELIENSAKDQEDEEKEEYKLKPLFKNKDLSSDIMMFSKSDFKHYRENHDAYVVGRIDKHQRHYKVYEKEDHKDIVYPPKEKSLDELIKEKKKKGIVGSVTMEYPEFKDTASEKTIKKISDTDDPYYGKMYDVKETDNKYTVGYAYIGDNKFLQVASFNPFWLLLPLLLALIVIVALNLPKDSPLLNIIPGTKTEDNDQPVAVEQLPNCDYLLFPETITLTKDNPSIRLCNLESNKDLWYISYQVYIDDEPLMDINNPKQIYNTGAIKPGFQVDGTKDKNLNLYDRLDAGTYKLTAKATQYKYEANDKGQHLKTSIGQNIITTLVVEK